MKINLKILGVTLLFAFCCYKANTQVLYSSKGIDDSEQWYTYILIMVFSTSAPLIIEEVFDGFDIFSCCAVEHAVNKAIMNIIPIVQTANFLNIIVFLLIKFIFSMTLIFRLLWFINIFSLARNFWFIGKLFVI